jgi:NADH-quinone oxidoreductase subunit H
MSAAPLLPDLAMTLLFIAMAMGLLLAAGGLLTWVERKQSAVMSDRVGANRAYVRLPFTNVKLVWLGLFHGMADGLKLLLKENFTPRAHDLLGYRLAPVLAFAPVLLVFAVVPFGGMLDPGALVPALAPWFGGRTYPMQVASVDAGLLIVFAFGGFSIIGAMLAGWASENKFSLLGGLRAGSQMISYELVMALTVLGLLLVYGTVDLRAAVAHQSGTVAGWLPAWGIVYQPLGAVLFLTAAIAENKRIPFDLPEAESELVAGYFTEYSAMKMGLFMLSEYVQIAVTAALFATLFLGGFNLPYMTDAGFAFPWGTEVALAQWVRVPLQLATFLAKVALLCVVQIQIRWSLPRFRYDQMLGLSWKLLLPVSLANLAVTVLVAWWQGGAR